jgi:Gpi18-like mannosyltransferase
MEVLTESLKDLQQWLNKAKEFILKKDAYIAITITVLLILGGVFLGWYNNRVVPVNAAPSARYTLEPGNSLSFMSNWDGPNYIAIATHGYTDMSQTNFFPVYPLLIHILNQVISSPLDCALLISWVSLVGLIYFYLKIVNILFKKTGVEAIRASLLFLLFPTAIFFLATYTESLFAFLALGSIYFALQKKSLPAAALALPMSATHITGVFVLVLIGLILWEEKAKLSHAVATVITGSLGLIGYMIYLESKFKRPFSFITSQKSHGWLANNYAGLSGIGLFNIIFIVLIILSAIYWWRKRISLSIYSLLFLLIPIVGQQFGGFNRYVLMVFPVPLMLYDFLRKRPNLYIAVIVLTSLSWAYFLFQYAGGYVGG